jgi:general secretion pathway protein J
MRARGFTLIEMLVAITLVALMGVICWRGLAFVANQRTSIEQETSELAQLVRGFAQMETDVAERLPDIAVPARATTPELPLAISIGEDDGGAVLEILRAVPVGIMQSTPVHVLYRVDARGLVRSAEDSGEVLVLPGVVRMQVRVNAGGFWLDSGAVNPSAVRPFVRAGAIEIAVSDRDGARYVKVIAL